MASLEHPDIGCKAIIHKASSAALESLQISTMRTPKSTLLRPQTRLSEDTEIELLNLWIDAQKPESGSNPMSLPPLPSGVPVGCLTDGDTGSFSRFSGARRFSQPPLSRKTSRALRKSKNVKMTQIRTASLPQVLAGRDISVVAKRRSGETLAFVVS